VVKANIIIIIIIEYFTMQWPNAQHTNKKNKKKTGGENVRENSSCKSLWHEQFQWGAQRQQNALEPHSSTSLLCGRVWAWPGRWASRWAWRRTALEKRRANLLPTFWASK